MNFAISKKARIKMVNNASIAIIILSFAMTFCLPAVHAGWIEDKLNNIGEKIEQLNPLSKEDSFTENDFAAQMIKDILFGIGGTIDNTLTDTNPLYTLAVGKYNDDGSWSDAGIVDEAVFNTFKGIAALWCIAIAMARFIQNVDKGIDPFEAIFKILIEICVVIIFIMYLERIIGLLCNIGIQITTMINESGKQSSGSAGLKSADEISMDAVNAFLIKLVGKTEGTLGWRMETSLMLFLPWVLSIAVNLGAKLACYQVLIEIGIRRMFTPLAIGDIYQEGLRSPGVRYLKKLLAAFLKITIIVMLGYFGHALALEGTTDVNGLTYCFNLIIVDFTCVTIMFKAGEYANDIVGV